MISNILSTYKTEIICSSYGYIIANQEKHCRWGRYANNLYTNPVYAIMGFGIGYSIKYIPYILNRIIMI